MDHYGMELDPGPPRDFADLKTLVMARSGSLPRRLAQIASFALDNPDEIAFGTAASIATRAGVQPSTLVRLSQALGYQGFSDLQQVFRSRLKDRVLNYDERLKHLRAHAAAGSRAGGILEGFLSSAERSLAEARHTIEPEKLDDAVALLAGAETIYLVGLRRSFPIAAYMGYALGKLGVRNTLVDGLAGLAIEQIGFAGARDAIIAISFAPYASETAALAEAARDRQAKIVSITDSAFSPIAPLADLWFEVAEANYEGFRSMSATLSLAMTLCVAIGEQRGER
jgi:DNA-binding MurR/RpiR family transcriptional regulator